MILMNYSIHEDLARAEEIQGPSDRSFGFVFAAVFVLIGVRPLLSRQPVRAWALGLGAAFLIVGLARAAILAPLNRFWLRVGLVIERVVSPVALSILFFLAFAPVGLLMRCTGKNPLRNGFDRDAKTYWIYRDPPGPPPDMMLRQF
jgi:Saxitoxin biosynthesis operon protein SxtJ